MDIVVNPIPGIIVSDFLENVIIISIIQSAMHIQQDISISLEYHPL